MWMRERRRAAQRHRTDSPRDATRRAAVVAIEAATRFARWRRRQRAQAGRPAGWFDGWDAIGSLIGHLVMAEISWGGDYRSFLLARYSCDAVHETPVSIPKRSGHADPLTLELLRWIDSRPRTYAEAMEAWRSTCPR